MKLLIFIFIFTIIGCSQRIKVPINRMITPEVIGHGVDLEYDQIGFSEGKLDFSNSETDNPLLMGAVSNRSLYMALGIAPNADIFVKVPQESSSLLGIKVQIIGLPSKQRATGSQLAFTIAMGSERDTFEGQYKINLKSDVKDYSLIYGYRTGTMSLIYASVSVSHYDFEGSIEGASAVLTSDEINYGAKNIMGGQLGLELGGSSFALKAEVSAQKIKWTNTEEKLLYFTGLALRSTF
jgi:hypothetical protein